LHFCIPNLDNFFANSALSINAEGNDYGYR
jgi:hypothetical protein